jgi:hypothetical protein
MQNRKNYVCFYDNLGDKVNGTIESVHTMDFFVLTNGNCIFLADNLFKPVFQKFPDI